METENNKSLTELPFKEFLDKSTNLITIFGVLNALFIYSSTIEIGVASEFLLPTFFFLSILVWFEIILFALDSANGNKKYEIFMLLAFCIQLGLLIYFVSIFISLIFWLVFYAIFFAITFGISHLLILLYKKRQNRKIKNDKHGVFLILLFSIIMTAIVFTKIFKPMLHPHVKQFEKALIEKKTQ